MIQFHHDKNYEWDNPIITKYKSLGIDVSVLNAANQHQFHCTALYLHRLIVPPDKRGQGLGTSFMQEFCKFCNENELPIGTEPRAIAGQNQEALIYFIEKFGFLHIKDTKVNMCWNIVKGDYIRLPKSC